MAWFYLGIFFRRRVRENQREMKPGMLALRMTPQGEYFKLNRQFPAQYQRRKTVKEACQMQRTSLT